MKRWQRFARKLGLLLLALILLYLALGLGFHVTWKGALEKCRALRRARGEFVEPEVLGGVIGLAFDVTFWPVYAGANIYHDGTPFATPCTHPPMESSPVNVGPSFDETHRDAFRTPVLWGGVFHRRPRGPVVGVSQACKPDHAARQIGMSRRRRA